jgi:hypothetical protein
MTRGLSPTPYALSRACRGGLGWGLLRASESTERGPTRLALLGTLPARGRGKKNYADAVVTPPSITMVWPVMKVEASEPR